MEMGRERVACCVCCVLWPPDSRLAEYSLQLLVDVWWYRTSGASLIHDLAYRTTDSYMSIYRSIYQWGTADTKIKNPSFENPELKVSPFKAWNIATLASLTATVFCFCFSLCNPFVVDWAQSTN